MLSDILVTFMFYTNSQYYRAYNYLGKIRGIELIKKYKSYLKKKAMNLWKKINKGEPVWEKWVGYLIMAIILAIVSLGYMGYNMVSSIKPTLDISAFERSFQKQLLAGTASLLLSPTVWISGVLFWRAFKNKPKKTE